MYGQAFMLKWLKLVPSSTHRKLGSSLALRWKENQAQNDDISALIVRLYKICHLNKTACHLTLSIFLSGVKCNFFPCLFSIYYCSAGVLKTLSLHMVYLWISWIGSWLSVHCHIPVQKWSRLLDSGHRQREYKLLMKL